MAPRPERILERHARRHVGVIAGVRAGDQVQILGRGRADAGRRDRPTSATLFELGSITKVVTALVLADMALEGLVALDDPVARHLPPGTGPPVRGRPMTLADLASHASGLPRLPKGLLRQALRDRRNPYARFTRTQLERAVREARVRRAPGRLRYSNFGAGLLGHVLSLRAGRGYEDLARERVCAPLGMAETRIAIPARDAPRLAQGHDRRGRPVPGWDLPALAGAGALRSTPSDMLRFLAGQLHPPDGRLGSAIRLTHEPRVRRGKLHVGLGWLSLPLGRGRARALWHNGGTGGFRAFAGFVPGAGAAVVVLSNSARSVDALGFRLLEAALDG